MMRNRLIKGGIILEILLMLVGLVFLSKAFFSAMNVYKFTHLTTLATVDGAVKSVSNYGLSLHIEFLLVTNEMVAFDQNVFVPRYKLGQHVPVIYNTLLSPAPRPLNSLSSMWFFAIVATRFPALSFLSGASGLRF